MKVSVIGSGYVGLVTGTCLADLGNSVVCLDIDTQKIDTLNAGGIPIFEPGLAELIKKNVAAGRLSFTTDVAHSVAHGQVQFIAVGTPPDEDGSADMQYVLAASRDIARHMTDFKVIVDKSTVPVGTAEKVKQAIHQVLAERKSEVDFAVVSNPEFLKEGAAVEDFMRPDRIVIGHEKNPRGEQAAQLMKKLYSPFTRNHDRILTMDVASAELTKYAANAMLATRISFMNELANLADTLGADIEQVRKGIGSDSRIGYHFLYAGIGYGGSCFPKDVSALQKTGQINGHTLKILDAVEAANEAQKQVLIGKIAKRFGTKLQEKVIALWGLAFKPNTDDMREAPSRVLIKALVAMGAKIKAHDPVAIDVARHTLALDLADNPLGLQHIEYCENSGAALAGADFLVIATEWKAYRSPDFDQIKSQLRHPVIFDGRNMYDPAEMKSIGIEYYGIGRSSQ
jgi:UDPglucose 6-dehydrogenase